MKRLVIIDDEAIVISGIQAILKRISIDIVLCGSATDGLSGFDLLMETRPDIVLTDIHMPGMDGLSLIESIQPYLPESVFVVISGYQEFEYARKALSLGVLDYLDKPITIPKLQHVLSRCIDALDKRAQPLTDREKALEEWMPLLLDAIRRDETGDILQCWDSMFELLAVEPNLDCLKEQVYKIACIATSVFFADSPAGNTAEKHFPSYANLQQLKTREQIMDYLDIILSRIMEKISLRVHNQESMPIAQILRYLDDHYQQDIGLCELADMVQMNPSYLSNLFKQKVGVSFVKYLTDLRMARAKQLLLEGQKVTQVCEQVGYHNYRYFCDLFKRLFGCTPSEYRGNNRC